MTLVIQGGLVLNPDDGTLGPADVVVEGSVIAKVGEHVTHASDADVLDATGQILIPGLINGHTHAHANIVRGVADSWTLEDLLNYSPAVYGHRSAQEQYISAALGAVEMLKTGCTAAYDLVMGLPAPDDEALEAVVRAYTDVGLRAVIAPAVADIVFYETVPGLMELLPDSLQAQVQALSAAPTRKLLAVCEAFVERWHETAEGRIRAAIAPTIPGQCTDEFLVEARAIADRHEIGVHVHLAETKPQAVHARRRWGSTIVEALDRLNVLGPRFVGAHGVWLTADDIALLGEHRSMIAHSPASNLKLGSGIAPVRELLDRGVGCALGTDGSISSDNQNVFEAMRIAAFSGKVRFPYQQDRWIGAPDALRMATIGGGRALGLPDRVGIIAPGYKADISILDAGSVFLNPRHDLTTLLTYAETGASVTTVMVDGRVLLRDGAVLSVDEGRIIEEASRVAEELRGRHRSAWRFAEEMRPYLQAACRAAASEPFPVNRYASPAHVPETG